MTLEPIKMPRFREWREDAKLSQVELAAETNLSQGTISRLESGRIAPTFDHANTIIHAINRLVEKRDKR
jgi:transcriptional regulator with XRE-family HTH domain